MDRTAEKRWLTNALVGFAILLVASFLPWIVLGGLGSANAFNSNAKILGITSPNWLILAASAVISLMAGLQYMGVAERRHPAAILLSLFGCIQATLGMAAILAGEPTEPAQAGSGGFPGEVIGSILPRPTSIEMGIGLPIALACLIWLLVSAVSYRTSVLKKIPTPEQASDDVAASSQG